MFDFIKQRLVADAKHAHKMWSVRLNMISAAIAGLYAVWPAFQGHVSLKTLVLGSIFLSIASTGARLIVQKKLHIKMLEQDDG